MLQAEKGEDIIDRVVEGLDNVAMGLCEAINNMPAIPQVTEVTIPEKKVLVFH